MQVKNFHIRLNKEHLQEDEQRLNAFLKQVQVKKTAQEIVNINSVAYWAVLVYYEQEEGKTPKPKFDSSTLPAEAKHRYELLRKWRADKALQEGVPTYILFRNEQLGAIALTYPTTLEDLLKIKGIGESRTNKYGAEILAVFRRA